MGILIDFNQIMISTMFVEIGNSGVEPDPNFLRHMFLNRIRLFRKKFKEEFGDIVICADSGRSWRRQYFEYYKAARKKNRDESSIDWDVVHKAMDDIYKELDEHFPYKCIKINNAEADDVIGTICHMHGTIMDSGEEKFVIISTDKDFIQLHVYANVKQYNPVKKEWVLHSNPKKYMAEHIMKGDRSDGIPNILSQDNCFMVGVRQKPMTKKKMETFVDNPHTMEADVLERFKRNRMLIDLAKTPKDIQADIMKIYNRDVEATRRGLFDYFIKNDLHNLLEHVGDF